MYTLPLLSPISTKALHVLFKAAKARWIAVFPQRKLSFECVQLCWTSLGFEFIGRKFRLGIIE